MRIAMKILRLISFILVAFVILLVFTGKSNLMHTYINWCKQASIWIVVMVYVIVSALCARLITFGICYKIVQGKKKLSNKIFWFAFTAFLIIQLASLPFLLQYRNLFP